MVRWLILLNEAAGTLVQSKTCDEADRIRAALQNQSIDADVRVLPGKELMEAARQAVHEPFAAIIAGGGDGTLNGIANILMDTGKPMGVLPLGTFNHFARELGLPLDLEQAAQALVKGKVEELAVAELNGKVFLNFSAIGLHPRVVRHRDAQLKTTDRAKKVATFFALARNLFRLPLLLVRVVTPERKTFRMTPSVIVCNNPYQMKVFGVEAASVPDRRLLNVYIARSTKPLGFVWLILQALMRRLHKTATFEVIAAPQIALELHRRPVHVTIDGDVESIDPPLRYRVRETGLKLIMPAKAEQAS